jgi:nicotinamidase/pyrazinamidase
MNGPHFVDESSSKRIIMNLPEKQHVASFDVDAQRTFTPICPDELPVAGGNEIGPELNRQAEFASVRLGSKDAHSPQAVWVTDDPEKIAQPGVEGDNVEEYWPVHAVPGTEGFELVPGLPHPADYDFFVWKGVELDMHPYGACYHDIAETLSTGVIEWLRAREISHVLLGGLATDFCVKATALQLQKAGFRVILNLAAVRGIADDAVAEALETMRNAGIETIDSVNALDAAA